MGGNPSSDKDTDDSIGIIFSSFNAQIQQDVDTILTNLADIVNTGSLSKDAELRLGQIFTTISRHVTHMQKQLTSAQRKLGGEEGPVAAYAFAERKLIKFMDFLLDIEWTLSDIKNSKHPDWEGNVSNIVKSLRTFMKTGGNFTHILNQVSTQKGSLESPSFAPKFKQPKSDKEGHRDEAWKARRIKELEVRLQVVDKQIRKL